MESNRITKGRLKGIILLTCSSAYWYDFIDKHWPWWRWKIPVVEIVQKGLDLGVFPRYLHWVILCLDGARKERMDPDWPNTLPSYETLKHYLWGKEKEGANAHS